MYNDPSELTQLNYDDITKRNLKNHKMSAKSNDENGLFFTALAFLENFEIFREEFFSSFQPPYKERLSGTQCQSRDM